MANMNVKTPRFYVDTINYLLSRGVSQNGEFDVIATGGSGTSATRGIQTGSEAELFDMNPLNKVDFDTSAAIDSHVIVTIDTQSTSSKKNFVAILNHNMNSADAKVLIKGSDTSGDVAAVNMGSATVMGTPTEVVNADAISSSIVTPATDGSTIVTFDESALRYWGIQFEGNGSNQFSSTDLFVGCILIGEYFDAPHAPDLEIQRQIIFDGVDVLESNGGKRFSNMRHSGRTHTSTSKSPFTLGYPAQEGYGGRLAYDMNFSFLASNQVMPTRYQSLIHVDDTVVSDVWNKTNGPHIPFIFSCDNTSTGANAESEHIFARFAQNSLNMSQVANDYWNVSMRIEEEF
jgi:hypothetical protein